MKECRELNGILNRGTVIRNSYTGRLRWPDGSRINRAMNETLIQAIEGPKQANIARISGRIYDSDSTYNYVGVDREEDDASTEEQEELGWTSGEVADC